MKNYQFGLIIGVLALIAIGVGMQVKKKKPCGCGGQVMDDAPVITPTASGD